jgi:hypothetical protein
VNGAGAFRPIASSEWEAANSKQRWRLPRVELELFGLLFAVRCSGQERLYSIRRRNTWKYWKKAIINQVYSPQRIINYATF